MIHGLLQGDHGVYVGATVIRRRTGIRNDLGFTGTLRVFTMSEDSWCNKKRDFDTLLRKFCSSCQAADEKDKIYALLGIATETKIIKNPLTRLPGRFEDRDSEDSGVFHGSQEGGLQWCTVDAAFAQVDNGTVSESAAEARGLTFFSGPCRRSSQKRSPLRQSQG